MDRIGQDEQDGSSADNLGFEISNLKFFILTISVHPC